MKTGRKFKNALKIAGFAGVIVAMILVVQKTQAQKTTPEKHQTVNKPNVKIKVIKQRDKYGNIIRYDSTYTSSWSSKGTMPAHADSIFKSMHAKFFNGQMSMNNPFFKAPLEMNDSAFFSDNFDNMADQDFRNMEKMFREEIQQNEKLFNQTPMIQAPAPKHKAPAVKLKKDKTSSKGNAPVSFL